MYKQTVYRIVPLENGNYEVTEVNFKPLTWWDSDGQTDRIEFKTMREACKAVVTMIDNEEAFEIASDYNSERFC